MSLLFKKPERKLDAFLVPLRDKKNNKIRIRITDDIVLQKIFKVKDQNANVIQCEIQQGHIKEIIHQYDKEVFDHVLENCNAWFQTDLSKEKIVEMFLPSLNNESELKTLISSIIEPVVVLDNIIRNSFCEIIPIMESKKKLSDIRIVLEIEAHGIYIRSRKFGIRWLVKSIRMFQDDIQPIENLFDMSACYDLVDSYKDDVKLFEEQVNKEIGDLEHKIKNLKEYVQRTKTMIDELDPSIDNMGELTKKTEALNKLLWNYQRDRLLEK